MNLNPVSIVLIEVNIAFLEETDMEVFGGTIRTVLSFSDHLVKISKMFFLIFVQF